MLIRLYEISWLVFLLILGLVFATGYMTPMAVVVFGFIASGLVFMGIMGVLPSQVGHSLHHEHIPKAKEYAKPRVQTPYVRSSSVIKSRAGNL